MQRIVCIGVFIWMLFAGPLSAQKLIINEVSNGPSGNQEYVELVVVDTTVVYDCAGMATPPCIDIRGWIFDDNSGYHGGSGVAAGCMRFSTNTIWSCVPVGTIILIYYSSDRNPAIPADDLSLTDGNCRIIAPDNNTTLFDRNSATPGAVACSYPGSGWTPGGSWGNTLLANPGDCARIVNLAGCEVFSLCWGSDNSNNLIYFSGSGAGRNWYFNNGDPTLQSNWSQGAAGVNETPGAPNNAANQAYINQFNNSCTPITPLSVTSSSANSGCSCTGTASVTASGSVTPYTYLWSNGATTSSVSGLCAGVYTCTVESAIHCTQTLIFTITATGSPNANAGSAQTITCASPTATLNGSSTTPGATFGWTGPGIVSGGSTATPTVNAAGTYTLTVTVGGCTATSTVSVTSNTTPPNVSIAAHPPLTCVTTTVTLVGSSITPGATFQWTSGPAAANYNVSSTGGYTLTVTNPANGCTASATSAVSSNTTPPNVSIAAPGTLTCATTTVTLAGSSTTPGASFQWTGGPATGGYGVTAPGTYTLTVTSPSNGCTNAATTTVTSNTTVPNAGITPPASLSCTTTTVILNGSSTTPGATFQWTGGPATANYSVTTAGTYTLTVTNPANGCTNTVTATVNNTASTPNVSIAAPAQLTCATTTLTLNGSSTTAGVSYSWTGAGIVSGGGTATPSVNAAGTYTLTVTDAGSCTNTATVSVSTDTTTPNVSIAAPGTLTCATTTVTLAGSSTTAGATFQWTSGPAAANYAVTSAGTYTLTVTDPSNGCTNTVTTTVAANTTTPNVSIAAPASLTCTTTTVTLNGSSTTPGATFQWTSGPATANYAVTAAGVYTLTVTNPANGCTSAATTTVTNTGATPNISIAAPAQLTCATTTVTLNSSSTTPGTTFQWTSGPAAANYPVTAAGVYTLTVTNPANGCTSTATTTVTSNTTVPNVSIASPSSLSCVTTAVTLNGSSTTPGAAFQWTSGPATANYSVTTAGIYTLTVTNPANGCTGIATATVTSNTTPPNVSIAPPASLTCVTTSVTMAGSSTTPGATFQWVSGPATANYTVTTAGIYTLTATDPSNGCTSIATATVASNTTAPGASIAPPAILTCATTTATLTGSSATAGVTFQWTSGPATASYAVTTAGIYTLTVTNPANGCTSAASTTVTSNTTAPGVSIAPPSSLTCTTATVTLTGSSITPGAVFQWTSGPATANYAVTAGGTYTLTATDPANGCTSMTTTTVASSIVLPDLSIAAPASLTCTTGTVTLAGSSTTAGVTYQWTSGPAAAAYSVTTGGTYTLTVTNPSNSCINTATVNVVSNTATPDVVIAPPQTLTCVTLTSTLAGSSITPGVTYQWTSGPASANYTVAAAGTYTLTVTDPSNGCTNTATATVASNTTVPDISIATPPALNCITTTVTLTGSSATAGIQFQWTSGPATATYDVSTAGTYSLTVTDPANGCTASSNVSVINTGIYPDISIAPPDTITCLNAFVTITGSSTTPGVTYQWLAGGPASPVNTVATGGIYTLNVTDPSNGCTSTDAVNVIASTTSPNVSVALPAQLNCINSSVTLNGSSNTPGVVYQWTSGPAAATYTVSAAGTYTLTVTNNANGCVNTATATVTSNINIPDLSIAAPQTITCSTPTVVLSGSSSVSGLNYQWTSGPAEANYPVNNAGTYTLTANNPANGCSNTASVTVISNTTTPNANFTPAVVRGCTPVCVSLIPALTVSPAWQYTWTFSNGISINGYSADTCFEQPGIYDASLSVIDPANGCSASYSVAAVAEAYVVPDAAFSYNPTNPTTYDPQVVFTNASTNADTYVWTFDGDSISTLTNPVWSFDLEGEHPVMLYAQNSFGCVDSVESIIVVEGEFAIYVPNAFTPGGDVFNETWRPVGVGVDETNYELSIFDRWGMRIFHTNDWENGAWDGRFNGTLVQVDTYIYKIKVSPKIKNGQDGRKELNGQVHVIR